VSTVPRKARAAPPAQWRAAGCAVLVACGVLCAVPTEPARAQVVAGPGDGTRVLVLEHRFGADEADSVAVALVRGVVYRAELTGAGTLLIVSRRRGGPSAFLVPVAGAAADAPRHFEVYAVQAGAHVVRVADVPPGTAVTLRLYQDVALGRRIAERRDRGTAIGLLVAGGIHSGYRLDPAGDPTPRGGRDAEGCLLIEPGDRLGTCVGAGRQSFPAESLSVTWAFIEGRVRLASTRLLFGWRTDLGVAARFSDALSSGPLNVSAALFSYGLQLTQHFSPQRWRRGWSLVVAWQHGRLGYAPETEFLTTDRVTAGVVWLP
jgi:hypothetical protein